ncbi:hypothetical protein NPIL_148951 [Nephila pilipes]|uniref:Uncharacterized protein n=1 Tax=Nephila pilipes TaxID=299642 RepID=A0A8X6Q1B2_NEPPI|nr:hypothetical protein NPIL_148951 [Nephila pilipes]
MEDPFQPPRPATIGALPPFILVCPKSTGPSSQLISQGAPQSRRSLIRRQLGGHVTSEDGRRGGGDPRWIINEIR